MPTVAELSAIYGNFMLGPRRGQDVCDTCFNLIEGHERCWACAHGQQWLDALAPISYSVAHEQLHHVLASYKRCGGEAARRLTTELAAVLWRHLAMHESCLAGAAGAAPAFDLVTTVPSGERSRDPVHPLRRLAGELVATTRQRYQPLLNRSPMPVPARAFALGKFQATRPLSGESVLLIDDTWTTGANAQSAAAALKRAGSGPVGAVVIGRHLNREWRRNNGRIRALHQPFDWDRCVFCAAQPAAVGDSAQREIGSARLATPDSS